MINLIKEDIKSKLEDGQDVSKLKFTCSKGNDCIKVKITYDKNNSKSTEIEIKFDVEELLKLKEKEDKEIQLHRIKEEEGIKYDIDDAKANEIKSLFPKKKDETAMNAIKATIKSELEKSLKDNNNDITINTFANVAKVLKSLINIAIKLNTGKINENSADKWIYSDVSSVDDLDALFGGTGEYVKAVKAKYDEIINKIKTDLDAINSGELSNNAKKSVDLKLLMMVRKRLKIKKIVEAINEYLKIDGVVITKYWSNAGPAKPADGSANGNVKAEIVFDSNGEVTNIVMPTTAETITKNGLVLFLEATQNATKIKDVMKALKDKLQDFIKSTGGETKL